MTDRLDLSVVMPAYNEEHAIEEVVDCIDRVVKQTGLRYELIVVDDGSVDGTRSRAFNYANKNGHVRVIGHDKNVGKGFAMRTGFLHAKGQGVIFIDTDLDIDPNKITDFIEALKDGDVVIASKRHPQSCVEAPLLRRFLSYGFNVLVRLLTGIKFRDTQTGLKAVRRNAVERIFLKLAVKRYAFDVELLTLATVHGLRVVELPIKIRMHCLFSLKEMWRMFIDLLGITYRLRVVKYYDVYKKR